MLIARRRARRRRQAPTATPDAGRPTRGRGRFSKDLQYVANGLWEAGAEAISINGQRLTSTSSIRFAGDAILVDYRPLARPYVVTALGDPDGPADRASPRAGAAPTCRPADNYGIRVSIDARGLDDLPAASALTVALRRSGRHTGAGSPARRLRRRPHRPPRRAP